MKPSMSKSIGALALLASSSSAFALMPPDQTVHVACVSVYTHENGASFVSDCDETANNLALKKPLNAKSGCAKDQAKFVSTTIEIPACMPVGMVQL